MLLGQGTRLSFASPAIGSYMLDASVKDKAGNSASADPIAFVFDNEAARTTAPAVQGEITAGERFQMVASLNDNLSIRDYYVTVNFGEDDRAGCWSSGASGCYRCRSADEPKPHRHSPRYRLWHANSDHGSVRGHAVGARC